MQFCFDVKIGLLIKNDYSIKQTLKNSGLDEETIKQTIDFLEHLEYLRYAPVQEQTNEDLLTQATDIIHHIEKNSK